MLEADRSEEELLQLATAISVIQAKAEHAEKRLAEAEAGLATQIQTLASQLSSLYQNFLVWSIEREKQRLLGEMIPGCPTLSVEQVVLHMRSIAALQSLEINVAAVTAETLLEQAERLLGRVQAEPDFACEVPSRPTFDAGPGAQSLRLNCTVPTCIAV